MKNMKYANNRDCMYVGKRARLYHSPLTDGGMRSWFLMDNTIMDALYTL